MNRKRLELRPHDPSWAEDFTREKARIIDATGDSTIRLEHVGSTSIPSVVAKPVLDIAIVCGEKGLDAIVAGLESLGYDYRGVFEPDEPDHFYATLDEGDVRLVQAHIYERETPDFRLKLAFRDTLRQDAKLANEYNDKKLELAAAAKDKSHYARIKDAWVGGFVDKLPTGRIGGL